MLLKLLSWQICVFVRNLKSLMWLTVVCYPVCCIILHRSGKTVSPTETTYGASPTSKDGTSVAATITDTSSDFSLIASTSTDIIATLPNEATTNVDSSTEPTTLNSTGTQCRHMSSEIIKTAKPTINMRFSSLKFLVDHLYGLCSIC